MIGIIGAGPIGSYISMKLSENYDVILFDPKKEFKKPCSGLFSKRILDFIPIPKSIIEHEVSSIRIHFPKKTVDLFISPHLLVVDRRKFDEFMYRIAKKHVKIKKERVENVKENGEIKTNKNTYYFDYVIGADGSLSVTRRSLGLPDPKFLLGIQFFTKEKNYENYAETWSTKNGFFWKIPRGKRTEYGIMEKPENAKILFDKFIQKFNLKPKDIESALIPTSVVYPKTKKIFLCGDAAGTAKPWSGGGVIWGLKCAEELVKSFPNHKKYEMLMKNFYFKSKFYEYFTKFVKKFYFLSPSKFSIDIDFII